jgi:hypothetical protein
MIYRKKEKNKNQKMGKHLTCHFSSLGFRLFISFVPSATLYLVLMLLLVFFNFSLLQSHLKTLQSFEQLGIL